jgi:hypothetical protein
MKKKSVIITACLLASVLSVVSLSAQAFDVADPTGFDPIPATSQFVDPLTPQSNTYAATNGTLGTAVDSFQDVLGWSDVAFNKWFGYVGISPLGTVSSSNKFYNLFDSMTNTYLFNLGFATKIGGIYLSAYYSGKFYDGSKDVTDRITQDNPLANGEYAATGTTTTTAYSGQPITNHINNFSVLAGIGNMGIKVGYFEAWQTLDAPNGTVKSDQQEANGYTAALEYSNYSESYGVLIPSASFGMPLNLGNLALTVNGTLAVNVARNNKSYDYDGDSSDFNPSSTPIPNNGSLLTSATPTITPSPNTSTGPTTSLSYADEGGYVQPDITLSAGIAFPKSGTASFGAGFEYRTNFNIYAKPDKDIVDGIKMGTFQSLTGTQDGKDANGTYSVTITYVEATEKSDWNNRITPSFWYANELSEKVTFGLGAQVAFTTGLNCEQRKDSATTRYSYKYYNETSAGSNYNYSTSTTYTREDGVTKQSWFGFAPELSFGLGYKVNDRWSFQGGLNVALPEWNSVTEVKTPSKGSVTKTSTSLSNGSHTSSSTVSPSDSSSPSTGNSADSNGGSTGGEQTVDTRQVTSSWGSLKTEYNLGVTFTLIPGLTFDALLQLDIEGNGDNEVSTGVFVPKNPFTDGDFFPKFSLLVTGTF